MSASVSRNRRASSAFPASSTRYPASNVGCSPSARRHRRDHQNYRLGGTIGHWRQPTPATMGSTSDRREYDGKGGSPSCRIGYQREPSLPSWLRRALHHTQGHSSAGQQARRKQWSILYRRFRSMGRTLMPELCVKRSPRLSHNSWPRGPGAWPETFSRVERRRSGDLMQEKTLRDRFTAISDAWTLAQGIVDTVREPVLVLDKDPRDGVARAVRPRLRGQALLPAPGAKER
jgi:hypothetical protein